MQAEDAAAAAATAAAAMERGDCGVPAFFAGRHVLVTGGSGFLGRVLVEKLLRCCPDVAAVHLLLRPKRGQPPDARLQPLTAVPLFDRLRAERPEALAKLRVVAGDVSQPELGLSAEDAHQLCACVSVLFHLAASVRFDDPLDKAVRINVCGTRDAVEMATRMPLLKAFVHVSTTYCHVSEGRARVQEQLYPAPIDWRVLTAAVQRPADAHALRVLTSKLLGEHPNTYTFTKAAAEHIVHDYSERIPTLILRPSVVISSLADPLPGWVDNFNGPVGLMVGAGKGLVHTAYGDPDCHVDYVPVDLVSKALVVSAWVRARTGPGPVQVYQAAQGDVGRITQGEMIHMVNNLGSRVPLSDMLYYPCGGATRHRAVFCLQFFFFQLLPAVFFDMLLAASGRKRLLVKIQRKIFVANLSLGYFLSQSWNFENARTFSLERELGEADHEDFSWNLEQVNIPAFLEAALQGGRRFLLKEDDTLVPAALKHYYRLRALHYMLKAIWYTGLMWLAVRLFLNMVSIFL